MAPDIAPDSSVPGDVHPVDAFILARLAKKGLTLSEPTDKVSLIRRASFDLIGLPPTPEEVQAFLADDSPKAGYAGAVVWLIVAGYTLLLPSVPPPENRERLTLSQRMGWDALTLLRHPDHRVVFITAALFNGTVASLFPYTPPHLVELGFQHTTALMSLVRAAANNAAAPPSLCPTT